MTELKRPKRWSYSSLSTYNQCPLKWKFSYIDNIAWPSSAAMERGTRMHLMAEEFVNGKVSFIAPEIKRVGPTLLLLKGLGAKTEHTWLLDRNWQPVEHQDDAWVKAIVDVHYLINDVLFVKDHKSGQMYDDHKAQLELYSIMGLQSYPEVKRAESSAIYFDAGVEGNEGSVIRSMVPNLIKKWHGAATIMMEDDEFTARPSNYNCKWCPFSAKKGGPCPSPF